MIHVHTKLEVSSFNRYRDRRGPNFKWGSRDPGHAHFGGNFIFYRTVLAMMHLHNFDDLTRIYCRLRFDHAVISIRLRCVSPPA